MPFLLGKPGCCGGLVSIACLRKIIWISQFVMWPLTQNFHQLFRCPALRYSQGKKARQMRKCTTNLSRLGVSRLRSWSSKDLSTSCPEILKDISANHEQLWSCSYVMLNQDDWKMRVCITRLHSVCWLLRDFFLSPLMQFHSLAPLHSHSSKCIAQQSR